MDKKTKKMIEDERVRLLERLKNAEPGSNESKVVLEDLKALGELEKTESQSKLIEKKGMRDFILKAADWAVSILGIAVTVGVTVYDWRKRDEAEARYFKAEENGYYPSNPPEKGLFNRIFK